jgi:hypothetical protein
MHLSGLVYGQSRAGGCGVGTMRDEPSKLNQDLVTSKSVTLKLSDLNPSGFALNIYVKLVSPAKLAFK